MEEKRSAPVPCWCNPKREWLLFTLIIQPKSCQKVLCPLCQQKDLFLADPEFETIYEIAMNET